MDIEKLINLPESKTLEFKRDTSSLDSILKAVISFANTAGGIILIGIDDDGTIVGLDKACKEQEKIVNSIANRIKPLLLPDFTIITLRDKQILVIQIKAGVSRIRNPVIARIFSELDLVEEWGSGYKRIKDACQKDNYPEPTWEEYGTVLRVTFYPHTNLTRQTDSWAPNQHQVGTKSVPSRYQVGTKSGPSRH